MTVTTGPTQINPSHHVKLTDGIDTVGLVLVDGYGNPDVRGFDRNTSNSAIKMYTGEQKYDDGMPPYTPQSMSDFSGGFGASVFDDDKSRYGWGLRAFTHNGKFEIGPQPVWTTGLYRYWPHNNFDYYWQTLTTSYPYLAVKFTTTSTTEMTTVHFVAKGDVTSLEVYIATDGGGYPDTKVDNEGTVSAETDTGEYVVTIDVSTTGISTATDYWIVFHGVGTFTSIDILCAYATGAPSTMRTTATPAWDEELAIDSVGIFYVLERSLADRNYRFFEYKGALFVYANYDDSTQTLLFLVGDQGVVKAGSTVTDVTIDSGFATWTADQAIGSIMVIMAGTGSTQPRNFRVIEGNDNTGDTAAGDTVFEFDNDPWEIAPDATSEVAIIASDKYTVITPDITGSNPWTGLKVTDVLVANDAVYFAHGDANDMTRMRIYNSTGTWTAEWNVEAADSECTYLAQATDPEGSFIWKAKGGNPANVAKAPSVDCSGTAAAADLVWEDEIGVGDTGARITKMLEYGEDYGQLHILKENGLYKVNLASDDTDYITRIPISAFPNTKDWRNGRTAVVHDTYLFFSWHDTVLRYYRNYLDNIGPNSQDVNIPDDYKGVIRTLISYPGMLVACIDAGDDGYSTVNAYNGNGWCNLFTSPVKGMRIQSAYIQSIPGNNVDRLWISCGIKIAWIPISVNPLTDVRSGYNKYKNAWNAKIDMAKIFGARRKALKYVSKFEFYTYQDEYGYNLFVYSPKYYKVYFEDAGLLIYGGIGSIYPISETYDSETDSNEEIELNPSYPVYVFKPSITIEYNYPDEPFALENITFDVLTRDKKRYIDTLTFKVADYDKDLNGDFDDYLDHNTKLNKLDTWDENHARLTMTSIVKQLDSKYVFIDTGPQKLKSIMTEDRQQAYIMRMVVYEVGDSS